MNRRTYLRLFGASAATTALAGCSSNGSESGETGTAEADEDTEDDYTDPALVVDDYVLKNTNPVALDSAATGDLLTRVHWHGEDGHWHRAPLTLQADEPLAAVIRFVDENNEELPLGETYRVTAEPTEETPDGLFTTSVNGNVIQFTGQQAGEGAVMFRLWRGDELKFEPPTALEVVVE